MASQADVEYVYINQTTGEYKIIPESEVSVCQDDDGTAVLCYSGTQSESHTQQALQQDATVERGSSTAGLGDVFYLTEDGEFVTDSDDNQHYIKLEDEQVIEVADGEQEGGVDECISEDQQEEEDLGTSEDTKFVMVSDQEVLVVKKLGAVRRNVLAASNGYFSQTMVAPHGQHHKNGVPDSLESLASSEARLMKSRRRTAPQSVKKVPKLVQDFLLPHLDNGTFGDRLVWIDRSAGTFAMSWSHKNGAEWRVDDCAVFREWDRLKQRAVQEDHPQYWMESKQRFRAALAKVSISCSIDSEEYKSSKRKIFQIKWTRETRPDILDKVCVQSKYFDLPPRGSMAQESRLTQERMPEDFVVEAYAEEEVVSSVNEIFPSGTTDFQVGGLHTEIVQQDTEEQRSLEAAVSSVTESIQANSTLEQHEQDNLDHLHQFIQQEGSEEQQQRVMNSTVSEQYARVGLESGGCGTPLDSTLHDMSAQQDAAAILSSRFFTERKHRREYERRRPVRRESLKPAEKVLRRCKRRPAPTYTICPLCRYCTANYAVLLRHLMVHREERAFACLHCTRGFKIPELLLQHLREHHHAGSPSLCFLASIEAKSVRKLRRSELRFVYRNLHTCAVCAEHCFTQHDLLHHAQELHGIEALKEVRRGAIVNRRRTRIRMRQKFVRPERRSSGNNRKVNGSGGSARTGGAGHKSKRRKLLYNNTHQTSLVVCDGEVLIEEAPIDWAEHVLG